MKKIICTLYQFNNIINYYFTCVDRTGSNVVIEEEFHVDVNIDKEFNIETLTEKSNAVITKLQSINYFKKGLYVSLNIQGIFNEKIVFPKLSNKELKKSLLMTLDKLYENFQEKYYPSVCVTSVTSQSVELFVTMCDVEFYTKCMFILNYIGSKIENIVLTPYALKQFVLENSFFQADKNFIFINIDRLYTMVIFCKGQVLLNHRTFNIGTVTLDKEISKLREVTEEQSHTMRMNRERIEELPQVIEEKFGPVIKYLKLLGGAYPKEEVYNIRFHSEDYSNEDIVNTFEKYIPGCNVSPVELDMVSKMSFLTICAFNPPNAQTDPIFPSRVK